ncbi:hypothetical protein IAR55_000524 [Kwoniella newhampshirensis]|uniref:Integral membrane protein n=1 Tax=Kwoniella newhampshirensis TaxID=1651941 RepID=A0AAW0Z7F8_9TREE
MSRPHPAFSTPKPVDAHPKTLRIIFHVVSAAIMINGFVGVQGLAIDKAIGPQYGGFFQYLTILGLIATCIVMLLSTISDYLPGITFFRPIKRVFLLAALPVELVISSIYWSLVLLAPHLMFPASPDAGSSSEPSSSGGQELLFRIPLWMDISMHLAPALALIADFFILERKFRPPVSTYGALLLATTFGTAYGFWAEHCASINGNFAYPFLNIMNLQQRIATYAGATFGAWAVFRGLNKLHK